MGKGTRLQREKEISENFEQAVVTSRVLQRDHFFGETALFAAIATRRSSPRRRPCYEPGTRSVSDHAREHS